LNGKIVKFKLGAQIGETSAYASVFDLIEPKLPGCEDGCVIKVYGTTREEVAAVKDIIRGSMLLGDDIPQPKFIAADSTAKSPKPFLIQEKLHFGPPDNCTLCFFSWATPEKEFVALEAFEKNPGLGDAVLELFYKIQEKGLGWPDANLPNMYFKKAGDKWVAGILDSDFIAPFSERAGRLAKYYGEAEWETINRVGTLAHTRANTQNTIINEWFQAQAKTFPDNPFYRRSFESLSPADQTRAVQAFQKSKWTFFDENPGPYFPDAEFMAEKMLEKKDFIHYDPDTGEWTGVYIDAGKPLDRDKFKRYFPKMFDRDRPAPIDGTRPFDRTSMLMRGENPRGALTFYEFGFPRDFRAAAANVNARSANGEMLRMAA